MNGNRLLLFALLFAGAITLDLIKFLIAGKPTVVNWESFIHPFWVVTAGVVLLLSVYLPLVRKIAFWVYLTIFVVAYLNIYLSFSESLTYFCMIFNLVLTSVFFFSQPSARGLP